MRNVALCSYRPSDTNNKLNSTQYNKPQYSNKKETYRLKGNEWETENLIEESRDAKCADVLMTNEMHNSFNQFLFNSFLSVLQVANESSRSKHVEKTKRTVE